MLPFDQEGIVFPRIVQYGTAKLEDTKPIIYSPTEAYVRLNAEDLLVISRTDFTYRKADATIRYLPEINI